MARKKQQDNEEKSFDPFSMIDDEIDGMEKRFKLNSMSIDKNEPRFSTGLLSLDTMLGGGLLGGGWYTFFGGEQSAKSTTAMNVMASIVAQKDFTGKAAAFDYEGSTQGDYVENIMRGMGIKEDITNVFGIRDDETGQWVVKPRIRYYSPDTGEKFFDYLAKLEKVLPDKVKMNDSWYYVFENTKANQKSLKGHYDKAYFSKHNKFRVPAKDGSIQAVVLVDSYPAMLPSQADEKDEGDKSIGLQARMFSEGMKRVKSAMRRKRVVVLGVNQLRKIPMAMYGPTENEPCGESLKFYCGRGDMEVFSDKGMLSLNDVYRNPVDSILSLEGREDVALFDYMGDHVTSTILLQNGQYLSGRREHRVMTVSPGKLEPKWTQLKDVKSNHYLPVKVGGDVWSKTTPLFDFDFVPSNVQGLNSGGPDCILPSSMTLELAELLGMLTADGYLCNGRINFTNSNERKLRLYSDLCGSVFGITPKRREHQGKNIDLTFNSKKVSAFLTYLGVYNKKSRDKVVSWAIKQSPREYIIAFLQGMFNCDSYGLGKKHDSRSCQFVFNTYSGELAKTVQLMLLNLGVFSSLEREYSGHNSPAKDPSNPSLCNYNTLKVSGAADVEKLYDTVWIRKNRSKAKEAIHDYETIPRYKRIKTGSDKLPELESFRSKANPFIKWVKKDLGFDTLFLSDFTEELFREFEEYCAALPNAMQRSTYRKSAEYVHSFVEYTRKNNLVWVKAAENYHASEPTPVYDMNMPKTHTTVFNGVVSHNSDCRIKTASVSIPHAKGMLEEEQSVCYDGYDNYRYIRFRTQKNKLGGIPNQKVDLRLVVENANGDATGFCRTWDAYQYLKMTGQVAGTRKKIKFLEGMNVKTRDANGKEKVVWVDFKSPLAGCSLSWIDFKTLIEGYKSDIRELCVDRLGMKRPMMFRSFLEKQVQNGKGYQYTLDLKRKVSETKKSSADDDDDDDEE